MSEEALHSALWAAVQAGLVLRQKGTSRFLHDRVQEAAYALIPESERAAAHLAIGRRLAAHANPKAVEESIFEIVGQLNRAAALIDSSEERERLAELNLIAGQRAKASTAYASALIHFTIGAAMAPVDAWERRRELAFALALHGAECEFLTGALSEAEARLAELKPRAASLPELATVTRLQVDLFMTLGRSDLAVAVGLDYLRRLGVAWSAHPTKDEVRQEYAQIWRQLGERPIEALLELPPMTDPVACATMEVLTSLVTPALWSDENLRCLVIGRMGNLSLQHGNSDVSCYAYTAVGTVLGPYFGDYKSGFRFGQLGLDLVERFGMGRLTARVYLAFANLAKPSTSARAVGLLARRAFDAAQQAGDLTYAAISCNSLITQLLARGDRLADVQREAEAGLDFARKARFGLVVDAITAQLELVRTLRGLTPTFGSFDEAGFNEQQFERRVEGEPGLAIAALLYWIRELQARAFAGDNAAAVAAATKAKRLLWMSPVIFERADYHFYAALALAALCSEAPGSENAQYREVLADHHRQLQELADHIPENFENRAALVGAEIARLEGRTLEAMRLYEQAIRSARANGFVHNEALANELAARFYAARGFETIAHAYLRNAHHCYLQWGADGKARQLEEAYPHLGTKEPPAGPIGTIATPVDRLDLATVIKVSQTVSSEMVLESLIDTLLRTAIEQAGAERGLLILARGPEQRIAAEAVTSGDTASVQFRDLPAAATVIPLSVLHHVSRTREAVILDDAARQSPFADDPYIRERKAHSILCLPLINQAKLIGVLYLENNLTPRAFAPSRIAVLKLLASQAAISIENSRLYQDLAEREARIRRSENELRDVIETIPAMADTLLPDGTIDFVNRNWLEFTGISPESSSRVGLRQFKETIHPDDVATHVKKWLASLASGEPYENESRIRASNGEYHWFLHRTVPLRDDSGKILKWYGISTDIDGRKRAEALLAGEKRILEMAAKGDSLAQILDALCRLVEEQTSGVCASVLLLEGDRLRYGAAPSLPKSYTEALDGIAVGPAEGSCGTAAYRGEQVIVEDIATDPLWAEGRDAALRHSLRACWSTPIFSPQGKVIATFAMYYREPRRPSRRDQEIVEQITQMAGVAIERKRTLEALRHSEALLAEAQRLTQTGSWAYNPRAAEISYWSDEMYRICGMAPQDGASMEKFWRLLHPEDYDRVKNRIGREGDEKRDFVDEYRIVLADGTLKHLLVSGHPSFDAAGNLVEIVGTTVDVSERKRAEEAVRKTQAELAHASRVATMGQLTASIAHEVNQPIAAAVTNAGAALRWLSLQQPDIVEARQALNRIVDNGIRAGKVIARIRALVKKAPPRKERIAINDAILEVVALTHGEAKKNGVSVRTELARGLQDIDGDRVQLQQVILNLIVNAIEAMGETNGTPRNLVLSTEKAEPNGVLVAVRDSGPGLAPEALDHIFDAFYTTKASGMGMGLSICRSIIEAHGGRLWAGANEPSGVVFHFSLPVGDQDA